MPCQYSSDDDTQNTKNWLNYNDHSMLLFKQDGKRLKMNKII